MKRLLVLGLMAAAGCATVMVTKEHRERIDEYRRSGKLAEAKAEIGYTVSPAPTFWWSLLPGANKVHIVRKIHQSPYYKDFSRDYPRLSGHLTADGTICLAFSWFPYVYCYTMPCQMGSGVFPDVARVNNLAYMYHLDAKQKAESADQVKAVEKPTE